MKRTTENGAILGRDLTQAEIATGTRECAVSGLPGRIRDRRKRAVGVGTVGMLARFGLAIDRHGRLIRAEEER